MRKVSLMTMSMFMGVYLKFMYDHDKEDLLYGYEEILEMTAEAGYEAIDVTSWEVELFGLELLKELLQKYCLKVSSLIYLGQFARMDEEGFEERVKKAEQGADIAAALETEVLMLVPQAQEGIEQYTPDEVRSAMIKHWIPVTAYAREKGLHVVVEDTPDLKLHFCRAEDVKKVLDEVPGLELVYDSANMTLAGEDPIEYLKEFEGRIGYVHLKDYRQAPAGSMMREYAQDGSAMSTAPVGTGIIDLPEVVRQLERMRYTGGMTVEFYVDDDKKYVKSLIRSREYVEAIKEELCRQE